MANLSRIAHSLGKEILITAKSRIVPQKKKFVHRAILHADR